MASPPPHAFELNGGRLCLDFCNTVNHRDGRAEERLGGYRRLIEWGRAAGVLSGEEAARLGRQAERNPTQAVTVLERALGLRAALRATFGAIAGDRRPPPASLEALNSELAAAMAGSQVVPTEAGFTWVWAPGGRALDAVLWPVARSAADLLTAGPLAADPLAALRTCEGPGCGCLFLDTTRNRSRRWCDMRVCGNRAKARRFHGRARMSA